MPAAFGEWLARKRGERKWTLAELEERSEVNLTHISKLETGRARPSREVARRLAEALEADVAEAMVAAAFVPYDERPFMRDVEAMMVAARFSVLTPEERSVVEAALRAVEEARGPAGAAAAEPSAALEGATVTLYASPRSRRRHVRTAS